MRAITVRPTRSDSFSLDDISAPPGAGDVLARTLAVGVCGTAREILHGQYGTAPAGSDRLVIGQIVLENDVVFGLVHASRSHYEAAAMALQAANPAWPDRLITRRVPLRRWGEAFERWHGDVKVVLDFGA